MTFKQCYRVNGKLVHTREGNLWNQIKKRCKTGGKYQEENPTYVGTEMSENFKEFQFFAQWCQRQKGFMSKDSKGAFYHIDKDLLVRGNQVYSEEFCVFIPQALNSFLTNNKSNRGMYPVGVSGPQLAYRRYKYSARCSNGEGLVVFLGSFETPEDAFYEYKRYKESVAKEYAEKLQGCVDERVIEALLKYTVDIID